MLIYFEPSIQFIGHLISVVVILMILSGRREARATLSWLLIVIVFPYIGALLYFIFGYPTIKMMVDVKLKRDVNIDIYRYYNQLEEFEKNEKGQMILKVTNCSPTLCSNFEIFTSARDKYNRLIDDIKRAKYYIFLEYYVFRQDETGKYFIDLLARKASEGVKVYFLYDGIGAMGLSIRRGFLRPLVKAGGKVGVFLSPFSLKTFLKLNFRNHRKIAIVDGEVCYTGGMNIGNEYIGEVFNQSKWYDIHARFYGDAVHEVEEVFARDWYFSTNENLQELIRKHERKVGGDTTVQVISSGPDQKIPLIYNTLYTAISLAKERIDIITPYLIPDQPLMELLRNLAMRGVKIRLILPGYNNHPLVAYAGRSYYEDLLEVGIEIYETKDVMLHAKIIVIDNDWCTLGTANMDTRSFMLNFELNIIIYSYNFVKKVDEIVQDYLDVSKKVYYEDFTKRAYIKRIFEGICRTISPVL
ncbi:MAG: cardiolipin synthase [Deferribacterota bacterium]|nr:cardiolipin synthase [Deferribacterota bacterium]